MTDHATRGRSNDRGSPSWFVLLAIGAAALNLRPAISSIGPVAERIHVDVLAGPLAPGFLVAVPVLLFGIANPLVQWASKRWSLNGIVLCALVALALAIAARSAFGTLSLVVGTIVAGVSIAFANIALPAVIRQVSGRNSGVSTGIYSAGINTGAAVAAGLTVPLAAILALQWPQALQLWAVPAAMAALMWCWMPRDGVPRRTAYARTGSGGGGIWLIVGFFGIQSTLYYSVTTWLPTMLADRSVDAMTGGVLLSLVNWAGIPASFAVPYLCRFRRTIPYLAALCGVAWAIGLALALFTPAMVGGALILGIAQGASLSLGLAMVVLASKSGEHAVGVSGRVQGFGYTIAAFGPLLAGAGALLAGTWRGVELAHFALIVIMIVVGVGAALLLRRGSSASVDR